MSTSLIPVETVQQSILLIRGQKVILDSDLAKLYGVTTKRLNEQVRRNKDRFPEDFIFQLNNREVTHSRSQIATLKRGQNIKYRPYAFTEHGAIMAANVLSSKRAVEASIYVVRAFVKLREQLVSHTELALKLDLLEQGIATHDHAICSLFDAMRKLMTTPEPKKKHPIGFVVGEDG